MKTHTFAFAVALLVIGAGTAQAQQVDVGGTVGAMKFLYATHTYAGAGPLVTVHLTPKHALQVTSDLTVQSSSFSRRTEVLYLVQYRRTFSPRSGGTKWFLTAGGLGSARWTRLNAFTYTDMGSHYEQGKWVLNEPRTIDVPEQRHFSMWAPIVPIVGGGVEHPVTKRVALRAEVSNAIGPYFVLGVRTSAGVVVKLGKNRNQQ